MINGGHLEEAHRGDLGREDYKWVKEKERKSGWGQTNALGMILGSVGELNQGRKEKLLPCQCSLNDWWTI